MFLKPLQTRSPTTDSSLLNGLNTLNFDGSDYLQASSSNIKNENQTWVFIASVEATGSVDNTGGFYDFLW